MGVLPAKRRKGEIWMSDDQEQVAELKRFNQMDIGNWEYRLKRLEEEGLPRRVHTAEIMIGQLQGEVTAVKEIVRGIGTKLDSGIETLKVKQDSQHQDLKADQIKSHAFIKGIVWCGSGLVTLTALSPAIIKLIEKLGS